MAVSRASSAPPEIELRGVSGVGSFARVQCTPDLQPSDIFGSQIYDAQSGTCVIQLGPVHANFVLLDEINRSSVKTQSAMLEAMQERQTTFGGQSFPLPKPFMVLATQNPIEEEGTYVLPQAQMDRFLLKEVIDHPTPGEEVTVLQRSLSGARAADLRPVGTQRRLLPAGSGPAGLRRPGRAEPRGEGRQRHP